MCRYQKGKTNLDFTGARDSEWQWHQLGHMQVCTSLQTDNHASTPPLCFFTDRMPFLPPNQQRQSTEGTTKTQYITTNIQGNLDKGCMASKRCMQYSNSKQLSISTTDIQRPTSVLSDALKGRIATHQKCSFKLGDLDSPLIITHFLWSARV